MCKYLFNLSRIITKRSLHRYMYWYVALLRLAKGPLAWGTASSFAKIFQLQYWYIITTCALDANAIINLLSLAKVLKITFTLIGNTKRCPCNTEPLTTKVTHFQFKILQCIIYHCKNQPLSLVVEGISYSRLKTSFHFGKCFGLTSYMVFGNKTSSAFLLKPKLNHAQSTLEK